MTHFKPNKTYTTVALYAAGACAVAITIALLLFYFIPIREAAAPFFNALTPVLWGLVIAYLVRPLVKRLEPLFKRVAKRPKVVRAYAIALSYIIVFSALFAFVFFLIPALMGDTSTLGAKLVGLLREGEGWLKSLLSTLHLPTNLLDGLAQTLAKYYDNLIAFAGDLALGAVLGTYKTVFSFFLAATVLFHMEAFLGGLRRIVAAILPKSVCYFLHRVVKHADITFGKYLIGRIIEALIIGTIYLIVLPLIGMPYPYLVALVMVITNFIPVIGAYIGGIPCGLLILTENPIMVIWFVIICLGMEQIDGNIVIPRVIGSILGLRGVWIMVSVALFGGLFGIWGMFLSAPMFSVLYVVIRDFADARLRKKGRETAIADYEELFASQAPPRRRSLRAAWAAKHPKRTAESGEEETK